MFSACSNTGGASDVTPIPTAPGHNTHISPTLHNLKRVQQGMVTMFTLPNQTKIKNLVSIQSNVWFGEYDSNKIGEMNDQGQLNEYTLPTANAQPNWGTLGMNGNFWFSEEGANKIAEASSQGTITEYPLPTPDAKPGQTLLWGNMVWFAETNTHKIGRIDQSNQIVEFSLHGTPDQIAANSDQNNGLLWFTEPTNHRIGHITFDGQISDFPLPASITSLGSMVEDENGTLWFTTGQSTQNQLGYVTSNGHFTLFSTGRQNAVDQLIQDGDSIDFIEHNNNTIWTINKQGTIQARFAAPPNLTLPTPLITDPNNGSYWYAKTNGQQSQLWNLNISPYGP
jgi:virginiamycin B lyase